MSQQYRCQMYPEKFKDSTGFSKHFEVHMVQNLEDQMQDANQLQIKKHESVKQSPLSNQKYIAMCRT